MPYDREAVLAHPERFSDVEIVFSGWGAPVMDEAGMCNAMRKRQDLTALLDVIQDERVFYSTDESRVHSSRLLELPNVFITPHVAGSTGRECFRMRAWEVQECRRFLNGEPLLSPLTRECASQLA